MPPPLPAAPPPLPLPPAVQLRLLLPGDPAAAARGCPPVIVRRVSRTRAPLAIDSTRSERPVASSTVAAAPAPTIASRALPVMFRSPLALSSVAEGASDNRYRPAPSTIVSELDAALPQS